MPVSRSSSRRGTVALGVAALLALGLASCTSQPRSGPPPEGYATWDDYYDQQDIEAAGVEETADRALDLQDAPIGARR